MVLARVRSSSIRLISSPSRAFPTEVIPWVYETIAIKHRLTKLNPYWTYDKVGRLNHMIKDATTKLYRHESHEPLYQHLRLSVGAYNQA